MHLLFTVNARVHQRANRAYLKCYHAALTLRYRSTKEYIVIDAHQANVFVLCRFIVYKLSSGAYFKYSSGAH